MTNITFLFKRSVTMSYSLQAVVGGQPPVMIPNGTAADMTLEEGSHTIRASLPFRGNETGVAIAPLTVERGMRYEIVYTTTAMGAGVLTIKTFATDDYGIDANGRRVTRTRAASIAKTKGRAPGSALLVTAILVVMLLGFAGLYAYESLSLPWASTGRASVITEFNESVTISGLKISATEIRRDVRAPTATHVVAVRFVIENISNSEKGIFYYSSISAYADDVAVRERLGFMPDTDGERLAIGKIAAGKRMVGYYCVEIPEDAKRIELKVPLGNIGNRYANFAFDIPPVE